MVKCMFFFCKQKAAYEMRISDWSSDVCSSDLGGTLSPGAASANSRASVPSLDAGSGKGTDMNILLVGSGGREHALSWQLAQSPSCAKLYAAPGNPGIEAYAECVGVEIGSAS